MCDPNIGVLILFKEPEVCVCVRELDIKLKTPIPPLQNALLQRGRFCKKPEEQVLLLANSKANSGSMPMRTRLNKHLVLFIALSQFGQK